LPMSAIFVGTIVSSTTYALRGPCWGLTENSDKTPEHKRRM
jgi:hypothetical protein